MSPLGKRMPVELFTAMSRITGQITTHHVHVRDELNDTRRSILIFRDMGVADLHDLCAPRLESAEAWIEKDEILLVVPYRIKGTTSMLAQRTIQSRLGKNEHRVLIDVPPFRVEGNHYFAGQLHVEDALRRDRAPFGALSHVLVTFLPNPSVSFEADEIAFNSGRVTMLCSSFETRQAVS